MPTIQILFDDDKVNSEQVLQLGEFLRELCLNSRNLDVKFAFAYGENPKIKSNMYPLEVYVKITRSKILDEVAFMDEINHRIKAWKDEIKFPHPINILFIPMDWKILDSI